MLYREMCGEKVSWLGMGNMRLPKKADGTIDREKAQAIIDEAYAGGITYFDTAYRYHEGESERFIGAALKKYPRQSWLLASKFPGHQMGVKDGKIVFQGYLSALPARNPKELFEEQLQKCGVDYFDFYLLHNLCETSIDLYTNEDLGIVRYLMSEKKAGRIRHLGLSSHARAETIDRFLSLYDGFEFVQIQLNYLDWTLQDAKAKYEVIRKHGLPIVVMEPCRGGKLAALPADAEALLKAERPDDTAASWAFRYLQGLDGVQVVLSGMTTLEQLRENMALFSKDDPLSASEAKTLARVVEKLATLVPCTACRYCCDVCPQQLNIPKLIAIYNEVKNDGNPASLAFTLAAMKEEEKPGACLGCGQCAAVCPQGIDIPSILQDFAARLS